VCLRLELFLGEQGRELFELGIAEFEFFLQLLVLATDHRALLFEQHRPLNGIVVAGEQLAREIGHGVALRIPHLRFGRRCHARRKRGAARRRARRMSRETGRLHTNFSSRESGRLNRGRRGIPGTRRQAFAGVALVQLVR
jgi:hypothetical protein